VIALSVTPWWLTSKRIDTQRLSLRAISHADAAALADALWTNRDHLSPWVDVPSIEPSLAWMNARIEALAAAFTRGVRMLYTIRTHDGAFHGCAGLDPRSRDTHALSYWLCAASTSHGYATEAVAALCRVAFERGQASRLVVECRPSNVRSARVARRLGFVETARSAEIHEWTLTRSQNPFARGE
jgi:RimJ/RimL family protein N-acetyltransferase